MRAFIDTSSLFKKYVEEHGSKKFEQLLKTVFEIIVSPVTWIEINVILSRLLQEKKIDLKQSLWLQKEIKKDFNFFGKILWNQNLEDQAVQLSTQYSIKTLDSIQLAAASLSRADFFITSDKKLVTTARKVLKNVEFV